MSRTCTARLFSAVAVAGLVLASLFVARPLAAADSTPSFSRDIKSVLSNLSLIHI